MSWCALNQGAPDAGGGGGGLMLDSLSTCVAAYSTARRLRTGVTNLMRVREEGLDTEADIGATGADVLDQAALASHIGSEHARIVTWYEQSGHASAEDLAQATATAQPRIANAGTLLTTSSVPIMRQNSGQWWLELSTWTTRPATAAIIMLVEPGTSSRRGVSGSTSAAFALFVNGETSTTIVKPTATPAATVYVDGALVATDGVDSRDTAYDAIAASGLTIVTVRGVDLTADANWQTLRTGRLISTSSGYDRVAELVILDGTSTSEIDDVEADMAAYAGITL